MLIGCHAQSLINQDMARKAVEVVKNGQLQFFPKTYENTWFSWMNDMRCGLQT